MILLIIGFICLVAIAIVVYIVYLDNDIEWTEPYHDVYPYKDETEETKKK